MIYFDYLSEVFSGLLLAFHPEIFTAPCSLISFVPTAQSILTKIVIRKTKARFSHPCGATFGRPIFLWKMVEPGGFSSGLWGCKNNKAR
jgi:hypothetical protein